MTMQLEIKITTTPLKILILKLMMNVTNLPVDFDVTG